MSYFSEAFKAMNLLEEEAFNLSNNQEDIDAIKDFQDNDVLDGNIDVIDPDAETEDDLADSYVGKAVIECVVCHQKIYKDKEDLNIDDETGLVNIDEECPYCYSSDGFQIVGQIEPYSEYDNIEEPIVTIDGEVVEFDPSGKAEIQVEPDEDGKITVEFNGTGRTEEPEEIEDEDNTEVEDEDNTEIEDDEDEEDDKNKNESLRESLVGAITGGDRALDTVDNAVNNVGTVANTLVGKDSVLGGENGGAIISTVGQLLADAESEKEEMDEGIGDFIRDRVDDVKGAFGNRYVVRGHNRNDDYDKKTGDWSENHDKDEFTAFKRRSEADKYINDKYAEKNAEYNPKNRHAADMEYHNIGGMKRDLAGRVLDTARYSDRRSKADDKFNNSMDSEENSFYSSRNYHNDRDYDRHERNLDRIRKVHDDELDNIKVDKEYELSTMGYKQPKKKKHEDLEITEGFEHVNVETSDATLDMTQEENGKVTITSEPKEPHETGEEVIAPYDFDDAADVIEDGEDEALGDEDFDFDAEAEMGPEGGMSPEGEMGPEEGDIDLTSEGEPEDNEFADLSDEDFDLGEESPEEEDENKNESFHEAFEGSATRCIKGTNESCDGDECNESIGLAAALGGFAAAHPVATALGAGALGGFLGSKISNESVEDVELECLDENKFDEITEGYLKDVYENVNSFKTTKCYEDTMNESLIVEGTIGFNSGASRNVKFTFNPKYSKNNKYYFEGVCSQLVNGKKVPFKMAATINEGVVTPRAFKYHYTINECLVNGTVIK